MFDFKHFNNTFTFYYFISFLSSDSVAFLSQVSSDSCIHVSQNVYTVLHLRGPFHVNKDKKKKMFSIYNEKERVHVAIEKRNYITSNKVIY